MAKREKPLHLDMPFAEALRRYAQADPKELESRTKAKTQKKPRKKAASTARARSGIEKQADPSH
jgi:hypothetical protein